MSISTRTLPLILTTWALLVLISAVAQVLPIRALCPEVGVVVVVYLGLSVRRSVPAIAATAFAIGYLTDLLAAAPKGVFAISLLTLCLLVRRASVHMDVRGPLRVMGVVALASLFSGVMATLLRAVASEGVGLDLLALVPVQCFVNGIFAAPLLALLCRVGGPLAATEGSETTRLPLTRGNA